MTTPAYPGWIVQLDPPAVAPDRATLDIHNPATGIMIAATSPGAGIDWGTAQLTQYMSQQGMWGSLPAGFEVPNRTITIPLTLGVGSVDVDTARANLSSKVARLAVEGGQLLRQSATGPAMYADIVDATLVVPDKWAEGAGVETDIELVLTCLPDFYGDEITLDVMTSTDGILAGVLEQDGDTAIIAGDYPARCRIQIIDTSGADRHGLIYGLRSRHYDDATTAALVYEAEDLSPINGAEVAATGGASGGSAVTFSIPVSDEWTPMLLTSLADGSPLTHQGTYRVRARCMATGGTPSLRLAWSVGSLAVPITNDPVAVPAAGEWWLLDLGTVRLDPQPVGANAWYGVIQGYADTVPRPVAVDQVILEPLDDSAAEVVYAGPNASAVTVENATAVASTAANDVSFGNVAWTNPSFAEGAPDGQCAVGSVTSNALEWLKFTDFGFAIPSDAIVLGLVAEVYGETNDPGDAIFGPGVVKAGVVAAAGTTGPSNSGRLPSGSFAWTSAGSASDLWRTTITPTDVNDAGFGFACEFSSGGALTVQIDAARLTVYYQLESGFAIPNDAVLYAQRAAELRSEGMYRTYDGNVYGPISVVTGDLPRLPPSGAEQRPCELLARPSAGEFDTEADSALGDFTGQVSYWPCYLQRI